MNKTSETTVSTSVTLPPSTSVPDDSPRVTRTRLVTKALRRLVVAFGRSLLATTLFGGVAFLFANWVLSVYQVEPWARNTVMLTLIGVLVGVLVVSTCHEAGIRVRWSAGRLHIRLKKRS